MAPRGGQRALGPRGHRPGRAGGRPRPRCSPIRSGPSSSPSSWWCRRPGIGRWLEAALSRHPRQRGRRRRHLRQRRVPTRRRPARPARAEGARRRRLDRRGDDRSRRSASSSAPSATDRSRGSAPPRTRRRVHGRPRAPPTCSTSCSAGVPTSRTAGWPATTRTRARRCCASSRERAPAPPPHVALAPRRRAARRRRRRPGVDLPARVHVFGADTIPGGPADGRRARRAQPGARRARPPRRALGPEVRRRSWRPRRAWGDLPPERVRGDEGGDPLLRSWGTASGDAARLLAQLPARLTTDDRRRSGRDRARRAATLLGALQRHGDRRAALRRRTPPDRDGRSCTAASARCARSRSSATRSSTRSPTTRRSRRPTSSCSAPTCRGSRRTWRRCSATRRARRALPYVVRDRAVSRGRAARRRARLGAAARRRPRPAQRGARPAAPRRGPAALRDRRRRRGPHHRVGRDDRRPLGAGRRAPRAAPGSPRRSTPARGDVRSTGSLAGVALPEGAGVRRRCRSAPSTSGTPSSGSARCASSSTPSATLRRRGGAARRVAAWCDFARDRRRRALRHVACSTRRRAASWTGSWRRSSATRRASTPRSRSRSSERSSRIAPRRCATSSSPGRAASTVTSFAPLRNVPFRVVALLGVDEGSMERGPTADVAFGAAACRRSRPAHRPARRAPRRRPRRSRPAHRHLRVPRRRLERGGPAVHRARRAPRGARPRLRARRRRAGARTTRATRTATTSSSTATAPARSASTGARFAERSSCASRSTGEDALRAVLPGDLGRRAPRGSARRALRVPARPAARVPPRRRSASGSRVARRCPTTSCRRRSTTSSGGPAVTALTDEALDVARRRRDRGRVGGLRGGLGRATRRPALGAPRAASPSARSLAPTACRRARATCARQVDGAWGRGAFERRSIEVRARPAATSSSGDVDVFDGSRTVRWTASANDRALRVDAVLDVLAADRVAARGAVALAARVPRPLDGQVRDLDRPGRGAGGAPGARARGARRTSWRCDGAGSPSRCRSSSAAPWRCSAKFSDGPPPAAVRPARRGAPAVDAVPRRRRRGRTPPSATASTPPTRSSRALPIRDGRSRRRASTRAGRGSSRTRSPSSTGCAPSTTSASAP